MNRKWHPTGRIRYVVNKSGQFYLQQEWANYATTIFGLVPNDADEPPKTQWRVIPRVREQDLTAEELGIAKASDLPKDQSPS